MSIVGVRALTEKTLPELHRRTLIRERLTEPFWPPDSDRHGLLTQHLGMRIQEPELSAAAFKRKTLARAWDLATNHAVSTLDNAVKNTNKKKA